MSGTLFDVDDLPDRNTEIAEASAASYIVEADGGSRGNPGPAAFGTVVRDASDGRIVAEAAGYLGETTNNVAEYNGLVMGLRIVAELNPKARVEARLDSKLVVEQMSGRWAIKNPSMRELALQARSEISPSQVRYTWVPRAENKAADALVNEILDAVSMGNSDPIDRRY